MKYKAVYDVLNERRQATPGFCYHDRSGWRAYPQTYMTMQYPLWIIAEDAATGRRLWITQEGTRFSISIRRMDEQRRNYALPIALLVKTGQSWLRFCAISSSQRLWLCS